MTDNFPIIVRDKLTLSRPTVLRSLGGRGVGLWGAVGGGGGGGGGGGRGRGEWLRGCVSQCV